MGFKFFRALWPPFLPKNQGTQPNPLFWKGIETCKSHDVRMCKIDQEAFCRPWKFVDMRWPVKWTIVKLSWKLGNITTITEHACNKKQTASTAWITHFCCDAKQDTRMTLLVNVASICWQPICAWCECVLCQDLAPEPVRVTEWCNWVTQAKPYRVSRNKPNCSGQGNFACL